MNEVTSRNLVMNSKLTTLRLITPTQCLHPSAVPDLLLSLSPSGLSGGYGLTNHWTVTRHTEEMGRAAGLKCHPNLSTVHRGIH